MTRHSTVFALTAAAVACVLGAAKPVFSELQGFRAPVEAPKEHVPGYLWLEAEGFADIVKIGLAYYRNKVELCTEIRSDRSLF